MVDDIMTDEQSISDKTLNETIDNSQLIENPQIEYTPDMDLNSYVIPANFSEEEEREVMQLIESEMTRIKSEYDEVQHLTKCEAADAEYNGDHDFEDIDDINNPDVKLLLTTVTVDIIASRAFRQTATPNPAVMLEPEDEVKDMKQMFDRMDSLDYNLRNKSKLFDLSIPIYRDVTKYGVCILKTCFDHQSEIQTRKKVYRTNDINEFKKKYAKELTNLNSKEYQEYQKLSNGEDVAKKEEEDTLLYHGAKHYIVDWKKFFARPSIKDFRKHIVISELFKYNWYEVEQNIGFWDEDKVNEIKERFSTDYEQRDYDFYTSIVQYIRNGKLQRYLVTYETETRAIVRAIHYPYKDIMYTAYNIIEKHDSWIGYSISERMYDIVSTANSCINSFIKEQDLAHTPLIVSNGTKVGDWTIELGKPNLLPMTSGQNMSGEVGFMQYRMENISNDRIAFLQWIFMYIAVLTGVDLVTSAGASDPGDKNPTNARTQMKLMASTIRVEDFIITLQKGDAIVAKQVEDIVAMFPVDYKESTYTWVKSGEKKEIELSILNIPVRYVVSGSRMSFDRNADLQVVMGTIDFLAKFFPQVMEDAEVSRTLLLSVLQNSQGTIEKVKDTILKPLDLMVQSVKEQKGSLSATLQKAQAQGIDIKDFLRTISGQSMPKAGQGTPQGTPQMPIPQGAGNPNEAMPIPQQGMPV